MTERFSVDSVNMSMSEWIEKNTTLKKRPFSFKGYEFQRKIVDDMHPDLHVVKISQVGLTEVQIRKALAFLVRNRGTNLIFSLPDENMFSRVSKARVKPIVNEDKVFNTPEDVHNKAVRSTELMQFGQSFLYLVPAIESAATSISADVVMNDEVDLSDQKMISLFASRLQGSKFKISQKFSTPSFPSYGVDLNFQTSDQHMYLCRCEKCNHYNHPEFNHDFVHLPGMPDVKELTDITQDFEDQLDFANAYIMCEKCGHPLDLDNPALREWVPKFPNRINTRGYRITPFVNANLNLQYIMKSLWSYQKNEHVRGFHNTVLGVPYSDGNIQIPIADILASFTNMSLAPPLNSYADLWVGVDMGQVCHVTIGAGPNAENLEAISFYQVRVDEIVKHLADLVENNPNIRFGCVDRHPYEPTARDIFMATKGKIIPTEYRGAKEIHIVKDAYDEPSHIQVNHTTFLDNLATKIRKRKFPMSGYGYQKHVLQEHLRDMVREEEPGKEAHWTKLHGNDHYFHSTAFMAIAPKVREVMEFKSDSDKRVLTVAHIVTMSDNTPNIIGVDKRRRDAFN